MTGSIVGRPRRSRPYDRVNYKLDSDIRALLSSLAAKKGRGEGAQIEQLVLQAEAIDRLILKQEDLNMSSISREMKLLWDEITTGDEIEATDD